MCTKNAFPNLETILTSYSKQNSKSDKIRTLQTSGITITARKNSGCPCAEPNILKGAIIGCATDNGPSSPISGCTCCHHKARRTLELSAELSVSRDCWRKLIPQVCGVIFCDFRHACHRRRIFNMLNNFMHE